MSNSAILWITGRAKQCLVALAVLAILGLAAPSASASVSLSLTVDGGGPISLTSGVSDMGTSANNIGFTVTATSSDDNTGSGLVTTTIDINNKTNAVETITLLVTGSGYTMGGTLSSGETITGVNYSVSGTAGRGFNGAQDSATLSSSVAGTNLGNITGSVTGAGNGTAGYNFAPGSSTSGVDILLGSSSFSMSQTIALTLGTHNGKGDSAQFTITTSANPPTTIQGVPEPSSLAIGGIGALGLIGYGLRRRKALGA